MHIQNINISNILISWIKLGISGPEYLTKYIILQNEDSNRQEKDPKKRRKKEKKSKKSRKSHKHHKKKHEGSNDNDDYRNQNGLNKIKSPHNYDSSKLGHSSDKSVRGKERDFQYEKDRNEKYEKYSRYDSESTSRHSRNTGKEIEVSREKYLEERRRKQKSEELLENRRKNRPLSPPKEIYHRDRRRYESNDTHSLRPSKYNPSESSSSSFAASRIAPPPPENWDRRVTNGYREQYRNRSPGYHDHR